MRIQLSNNIVSSHDHENSREVLVYQSATFVTASSVHVFKEVYQQTNFSQITYKASSGMEGERLHVVFGLTGILGKNLKIFFSETARPTAVADLGGVLWVLQHPQLSPW